MLDEKSHKTNHRLIQKLISVNINSLSIECFLSCCNGSCNYRIVDRTES